MILISLFIILILLFMTWKLLKKYYSNIFIIFCNRFFLLWNRRYYPFFGFSDFSENFIFHEYFLHSVSSVLERRTNSKIFTIHHIINRSFNKYLSSNKKIHTLVLKENTMKTKDTKWLLLLKPIFQFSFPKYRIFYFIVFSKIEFSIQ
jgi:hypothetical protein